jgi:hypothetical protein
MVNRERVKLQLTISPKITRSSMRNITILIQITSHLSFMADVQFSNEFGKVAQNLNRKL